MCIVCEVLLKVGLNFTIKMKINIINKANKTQKLQDQMKKIIKRISNSGDEDLQLEHLKKKLLETEVELRNYKTSSQHTLADTISETGSDGDDDPQLYDCNYAEKMVLIGDNVYCRKIIYDMTMGSSHKATHIARKLLEGVFKMEILLKATLTGQTPSTQRLERQLEPVVLLCCKARTAIIDFAIKVSNERGWSPHNVKEIERAMSQRLGK